MFRIEKLIKTIILAILVTATVSCNNDPNTDVDIEIIGDAFVIKREINEKIQYANAYFLYANYPLSSASATTPDNLTVPLLVADQFSLTFSREPSYEDYTENIPQSGVFNFDAKHNDESYHTSDNLNFVDMGLPAISSTEYLVSAETLKVTWNLVPEADSYIVRLIDVDENVFFTGYLLDKEAESYEVNMTTGTWLDHPYFNQPFIVEVHATRYQQNTESLELYYIEEIAIAEKEIFWGVE